MEIDLGLVLLFFMILIFALIITLLVLRPIFQAYYNDPFHKYSQFNGENYDL